MDNLPVLQRRGFMRGVRGHSSQEVAMKEMKLVFVIILLMTMACGTEKEEETARDLFAEVEQAAIDQGLDYFLAGSYWDFGEDDKARDS